MASNGMGSKSGASRGNGEHGTSMTKQESMNTTTDGRSTMTTSFQSSGVSANGDLPISTPLLNLPNGAQPAPPISFIPPSDDDTIIQADLPSQDDADFDLMQPLPRITQERLDAYLTDLNTEETEPPKPFLSELSTGYCYDVRMRYHCELEPPKDRRDYHPEDPRRIFSIYRELCMAGLIQDDMLNQGGPVVKNPMARIAVREVDESEVELVHDLKHWEFMKQTAKLDADSLIELGYSLDSVYLNGVTFECAKLSAGGAIETARAVACGLVKNAIAIIRPPGHHAECSRPMGFCIFDNVSIATKVCMADFPDTCRKIMILDWDVHHGNGIQQAFYSDPNVLYVSLHVHEDGNFYPSGPYGDHLHCGAGAGLGRNINVPWPTKGMGDADYMYAFQQLIMPVGYEFDPDLVMIAAGFDAADGDQLGGCFVSPSCYAHMTHMLKSLAKGRVVTCLEGGYNLRSIARSALAVTRTLNGEPPPRLEEQTPTLRAVQTVQMVRTQQSRFWSCLYPKKAEEDEMNEVGAERMHDVLRHYQAAQMKEHWEMFDLHVYRDKMSKSFESQVMATPNFESDVPLMVIFHDPPEIVGYPNQVTGQLELHDSWLADARKLFVDWAGRQEYGVIDVNIPRFATGVDDDESVDEIEPRILAIQQLAAYLWDNYIEVNDHPQLFFVGMGMAYQGIMHLLNYRENFINLTTGLVNFIPSAPRGLRPSYSISANTLVPASDQNIFHLSRWYRANSLNYVGNTHSIWNPERMRKPSKRFGNLIQSPKTNIHDMMVEHFEEACSWMEARVSLSDGESVKQETQDAS